MGKHDDARAPAHPSDPAHDAWLAEQVERAVAPYRSLLTADELDWMTEQLMQQLLASDEHRRLASAARPRGLERSGEAPAPLMAPPGTVPGAVGPDPALQDRASEPAADVTDDERERGESSR